MPWYLGNSFTFSSGFIVPLAIWSGIWTGLALWHAARRNEHRWFIFFLVIHTAGVAEILYLMFVAKVFISCSPHRK